MMQSEQINELATALSKAQGEIVPALKDNLNPHFKSKYADLSSVWSACRASLSKHGLAVIQTMDVINGQLMMQTTLTHSSGQWIRSHLPIITANNNPQALGSAITYMRRYSLAAIVGVAPDDDDDAESAMPTPTKKEVAKISRQQAEDLNTLLQECDPNYQKSVWQTLKKSGIYLLTDLPVDLFTRLQAAATKNRDDYQTQLADQSLEMSE